MIQQGKVLSVSGDTAMVEIIRESACSSCHNKDSCATAAVSGCAKKQRVEVVAKNTALADVGQIVELSSESGKTLGIAFCVFVLPILLAFAVYYSGLHFLNETLSLILGVTLFFISFFSFFFGFDRSLRSRISVEITRIIE